MTFYNPVLIVGDKSLCYIAIHEICHSWTGNDVTNSNWSNFWLNEGFTVFEERKVTQQIYTKDFALTEAFVGNLSLYFDTHNLGVDNSYTSLYPIFNGDNPDNYVTNVPYEKGF